MNKIYIELDSYSGLVQKNIHISPTEGFFVLNSKPFGNSSLASYVVLLFK